MLDAGVRMHAQTPSVLIEPTTEIDVFIIAAAKRRIESADFLEYPPADQKRVALETVRPDVSAGGTCLLLQIVPGVIIATWNDEGKLRISRQSIA